MRVRSLLLRGDAPLRATVLEDLANGDWGLDGHVAESDSWD